MHSNQNEKFERKTKTKRGILFEIGIGAFFFKQITSFGFVSSLSLKIVDHYLVISHPLATLRHC